MVSITSGIVHFYFPLFVHLNSIIYRYEIKRGKHTAVCGKEQKRFIRFRSLGEDFTEENLKKVIAGEKESPEKNEKVPERKEAKPEKRKFDLVVDIQEKMAQGKNGGYVRWAKNIM